MSQFNWRTPIAQTLSVTFILLSCGFGCSRYTAVAMAVPAPNLLHSVYAFKRSAVLPSRAAINPISSAILTADHIFLDDDDDDEFIETVPFDDSYGFCSMSATQLESMGIDPLEITYMLEDDTFFEIEKDFSSLLMMTAMYDRFSFDSLLANESDFCGL